MNKVLNAVEGLRLAMVNADESALKALTAEKLSYGHTSGLVESRSEFIAAIVGDNKRDVFKKIELSDHAITVAGNVAVARHRFVAEVLVNGAPMAPDIRVMQVWVEDGGDWKLIARQAYRV